MEIVNVVNLSLSVSNFNILYTRTLHLIDLSTEYSKYNIGCEIELDLTVF